jgi:hypothetical protein
VPGHADPSAHLAALETCLEGLLSCFESEPYPALEVMDSTFTHVLRAFEDVQRELAAGGREANREGLQRCQRLYAVAVGLLARRREELGVERAALAEARTRLRRARPEGESGGSCDVRG